MKKILIQRSFIKKMICLTLVSLISSPLSMAAMPKTKTQTKTSASTGADTANAPQSESQNIQKVIDAFPVFKGRMSETAAAPIDNTWEEISDKDDVVVYKRKHEGSKFVEFRGEGLVDANIAKVLSVLMDTSRKLEWVDRSVEATDIALISDYERIEYNRTSAPWPVKDRDFLFHAMAYPQLKDHAILVTIKSIEDAKKPEADCCVRGELASSSYYLQALEEGKKTKVVVQIHADPKGNVPSWIVNMIQKSWPRKTLESLRAQAKKDDVKENQLFKTLLEHSYAQEKAASAGPSEHSGN